ncbi:hypothetical protein PENARI_c033G00931 [Penicillium arizonense]|uniref:Cell wall alpha-1,3-glucan synthase Mok11-14/Ags1-like transmembrane domain-containing protein n=1 Tax=Penicillium arizonense TaxID=1835702 RepID=A0A1F5L4U7_PENAI|nr:hypothetical protein PENARI_c033G00931 [Penicillium arizonense]OGE48066.1 hypothetical protein PENARI_c033G00931 [Penicillium arizonense]
MSHNASCKAHQVLSFTKVPQPPSPSTTAQRFTALRVPVLPLPVRNSPHCSVVKYSMTFVIIVILPFGFWTVFRAWAQNIAAGVYAAASSIGSLFSALDFVDQGAVPAKD